MKLARKVKTAAGMLDPSSGGALLDSLGFVRVFPRVRPFTMVGPHRLRTLFRVSREVERNGVPGDVVECGVNGHAFCVQYCEIASKRCLL